MFFDEVEQVAEIARRVGTAIFVVPDEVQVELPGAIVLRPEGKATITIEQVRDVLGLLATRQLEDRFVLIRPADKLGEEAENALLKNLEEPGEKVHFVLVTDSLSKLLPTVRSRAATYVWRRTGDEVTIGADEKTKALAKRLLAARADDLVGLVDELGKKKDGVRAFVLSVVGVAIEMAYKTYLLNGKIAFAARAEKLVAVYDAILQNGNTKLQIVANLV